MKPIIFSSDSIRAILAGKKTQTRRVITENTLRMLECGFTPAFVADKGNNPPYQPGDTLWVRETFAQVFSVEQTKKYHFYDPETYCVLDETKYPYYGYEYKAENPLSSRPTGWPANMENLLTRWKSPIFMPKEAARLFLRVTDVRVERVGDISEDDIVAEGIPPIDKDPSLGRAVVMRLNFMAHWSTLNAKRGYGWDKNPWVWAITFELLQDAQQVE